MDLWGCRLAFMEETGDGHRLDTTKLKRIVGTGTITARRMYKDSSPVPGRAALVGAADQCVRVQPADALSGHDVLLLDVRKPDPGSGIGLQC